MNRLLIFFISVLCLAQPVDPRWQVVRVGPAAQRPTSCASNRHVFVCSGSGCSPSPSLEFCVSGTFTQIGATGSVSSVFTRSGAITAQSGDYTASQVTNAATTNAANTFSAGAKQTVQASGTTAGAKITCATLPSAPATGDVACDSGASNTLKWYDGSTWQSAGIGGGGSGTVTSVDAECGTKTVSGSAITTSGSISGVLTVNAQTGTTYTVVSGDCGKLVTHTNGSAIAVTLPQATGSFGAGWYFDLQNRGVGTVTITPTTSTIDGSATLVLTTGHGVRIASDGTNYFSQRGMSSGGSGNSTSTSAFASCTAATAGDLCFPTDSPYLLRDTGSAFADWGPLWNLTPPDDATFSNLNSPSTVSTTGGSLFIASTSTGSDNVRGRKKAVPSAPYTVELGFIPQARGENFRSITLCLYDGTKLRTFGLVYSSGWIWAGQQWTNVTAVSASTTYGAALNFGQLFVKLVDDNTNWKWYWGTNLSNMELLLTETRNTFLTATDVGMCVDNNVGSGQAGAHFNHWKVY